MEDNDFLDIFRKRIEKIRIILIDQYPLIRQALRTGIEKQQDLEVIAEACDERELLALVPRLLPDIVVIGTDLPKSSSLGTTIKKIKKISGETKILLLIPASYQVNLLEFVGSGADGYVSKKKPMEGIIHALRSLIIEKDLQFYLPPIQEIPQEEVAEEGNDETRVKSDRLSSREIKILEYLADGMSNKEIASLMDLSLPTVKTHVSNILLKLQASSRTEAVTNGLKYGILNLKKVGR